MAKSGKSRSSAKNDKAKAPRSEQPTFGAARKRPEYVPGRYFVRVHPEAVRPHVGSLVRRPAGRGGPMRVTFSSELEAAIPKTVTEPLDYLRDKAGLKNVRPLFADAGRERLERAGLSARATANLAVAAASAAVEDDELAGLAICETDPGVSPRTIRHAQSAEAIDFIEPVPARWLSASGPDPMTNLQWGLRAIGWFDAARVDGRSMAVGVIDTGVDASHPELADRVAEYHHPGTRAEDIVGHGTHVAGIIGAQANNRVGIAGVAQCKLHVWKVFGDAPAADGEYYVDPDLMPDALRAAATSGLSAVNLSLGGTGSSRTEELLIKRLLDRGVAVVAAMGNEFEIDNATSYPAAYPGVLAVGSIAETRRRSSFSNTGAHIGICAPGSNILSTLPRRRSSYRDERDYASWSGTSMATPHVAGAAALVAALHPDFGAQDVQAHLRKTAATLSAMGRRARTNEYGDGLLDLKRALA